MMTAAFWIPVVVFSVAVVMASLVFIDIRLKTFKWYSVVIAFIVVAILAAISWSPYMDAVHQQERAQWRREHPNSRRDFE